MIQSLQWLSDELSHRLYPQMKDKNTGLEGAALAVVNKESAQRGELFIHHSHNHTDHERLC